MKKSKATEALRVATDIAAIKAALYKRGYRLRKQPKQPVWKVIVAPKYFELTYQPAPISAWVLHPLSQRDQRQAIALLPLSLLFILAGLIHVEHDKLLSCRRIDFLKPLPNLNCCLS